MARAQVDNNMEVILDAYAKSGLDLVFVSNWTSSKFGRMMLNKYGEIPNLKLIGPIYDVRKIKALFERTRIYIHGHSAGGTNPVLVESMWARLPIVAFDVPFNKHTTEFKAFYFSGTDDLVRLTRSLTDESLSRCADELFQTANQLYKWEDIRASYETLLFNKERE